MFASDQYALLDFGEGRKLERFGEFVLDRPALAAKGRPKRPRLWDAADSRFERALKGQQGRWEDRTEFPDSWSIRWQHLCLELKRNPYGHLGVFPEQSENWAWLGQQGTTRDRPLQLLNLFAYTGGATLAAASAGASITHVDAAENMVQRARRNASASSLETANIRWIVDDAVSFVDREIRRERIYDGVILDPPAYGHGGNHRIWQFERDLPKLLSQCWQLTAGMPKLFLFTCHATGWNPEHLRSFLHERCDGVPEAKLSCKKLSILSKDEQPLSAGLVARWCCHE